MHVFSLVKVNGGSMAPVLPDGAYALFRQARSCECGDVVLVDHPQFGLIVKIVSGFTSDGRVGLAGIASLSTSPARLGMVTTASVKGKLVARYVTRRPRS